MVSQHHTLPPPRAARVEVSPGLGCWLVCWTDQHHLHPLQPLCVEVIVSSSLHVAILSGPLFAEGLSVDAIVTSREHSSSSSGDQPEYGCDRATRVLIWSLRRSSVRVVTTLMSAIVTRSCSCPRCVLPWSGFLPPFASASGVDSRRSWLCASWSAGTSRRRHALVD